MKLFFCILLILLLLGFTNCSNKFNKAPKNSVPMRTKIDKSPYGGYTVIYDRDNQVFYGELIGSRNDTLVIINSQLHLLPMENIASGKVIYFQPYNFINIWLYSSIPTLLPLVHIAEYGGAPLLFTLVASGFNMLGALPAMGIENEFKNYHTFEDDRLSFMKFSRFPAGIPPQLDLNQLSAPEGFGVMIKE
ncbi:hypothetical protein KIH41_14525 [Litoribacter ruber]|uniref:hypothetical protein n=1 Tax=Litoribacter ruber TaxID=702568 RepID=UPI001BD92922|nr:hypothetical protein [Litoribacter ruber]MBT0812500.1 hypothetical protein [Litoribacter ruber]